MAILAVIPAVVAGAARAPMMRWRDKIAWHREFRSVGLDDMRARVHRKVFHGTPGKMEFARCWVWWAAHGLTVALALAGFTITIALGIASYFKD